MTLLPIHVAAGGLAIVLGAVALLAKNGGTIHRRGGLLFVYAISSWARTADPAAVCRDVLLAVASPRTPRVASLRSPSAGFA